MILNKLNKSILFGAQLLKLRQASKSFVTFFGFPLQTCISYSNSNLNLKKAIPRRLIDKQKPREDLFSLQDKRREYTPYQALKLIKLHTYTSFPESIDFCIRLNVNPKNGEQIVRGAINMPAGIGKTTIVAVLCTNSQWDELIQSGAKPDVHLLDQDIKKLQKGEINFQKMFTTPSHINKLKHLGKMLGPKGLMPNARVGTLVTVQELPKAVKNAKSGQITVRVDSGQNIHALLGKASFSDEQILTNLKAVMDFLVDKRPAGLKGKYFLQAFMKSTMGPRWRINLADIDPRTEKCIWSIEEAVVLEKLEAQKEAEKEKLVKNKK